VLIKSPLIAKLRGKSTQLAEFLFKVLHLDGFVTHQDGEIVGVPVLKGPGLQQGSIVLQLLFVFPMFLLFVAVLIPYDIHRTRVWGDGFQLFG
jgi:hypothetical protein